MAVAEYYVPTPLVRYQPRIPFAVRNYFQGTSVASYVAFGALAAMFVVAVFAKQIAPYDPLEAVGQPMAAPNADNLLGTDTVGRDVLSRVLCGMQTSWFGALAVVAFGVVFGGLVGLVAGARGGWFDAVLMRITDAFLALPGPILALCVVAALGRSYTNTLIGVAIVWWPLYTRIVRAEVRRLRASPHMEAARVGGASWWRLMYRHLLPGAIPVTIVTASLDIAALVLIVVRPVVPRPRRPAAGARTRLHERPRCHLHLQRLVDPHNACRRGGTHRARRQLRRRRDPGPDSRSLMLAVLPLRLLGAIPVLLVLILAVFTLQQVAPVDPVAALVGAKASPEVYEAARQQLGLDQPLPVQFWHYLTHAVQGDLGQSTVTRTPVVTDLATFLPVTLELLLLALIFTVIIGFFFGLATAQGWRGSGVLRVVMVSGASVPVFLACLLGMLVFYRFLNIFPITGQTSYVDAPAGPTHSLLIDSVLAGRPEIFFDDLYHLVLPAFCLALTPAAAVGRVLRSSLEATLRADHTRTARAKGLGEKRILIMHALRNSLGAVFAFIGLQWP